MVNIEKRKLAIISFKRIELPGQDDHLSIKTEKGTGNHVSKTLLNPHSKFGSVIHTNNMATY